MRHLFLTLALLAALLQGGVSVSASEPDRIVQMLDVNGVAPLDRPVYMTTGTIDVTLTTNLTCTPPEGKAGCGVITAAILHAPTDGEYPVYADVLDVVSSVVCESATEPSPGCQAGPGLSTFTYQFVAPKAGVYVLEVISVLGLDYQTPDLRLSTNFVATDDGAVYPEGQIYQIRGFAEIVVTDLKVA